jgi:hypothetical protein
MEDIINKIANGLPEIKFLEILEDIEKYLPQEDGNQHRFIPTPRGPGDYMYVLYIDINSTYITLELIRDMVTVVKPCRNNHHKIRSWEWANPKSGYDPKVIAGYILYG